MLIKEAIKDEMFKAKTENEKTSLLNEILKALHEVNESFCATIVEEGIYSKEKYNIECANIDNYLKQLSECIKESIRLYVISMRLKEIVKIELENSDLKNKIVRAQQLIDDAKVDASKTKKATINCIKSNMKISRDKIIAIANTTSILSAYIKPLEQPTEMLETYNNILLNIGMLVEELSNAGLWDENDEKPDIKLIKIIDIIEDESKGCIKKEPMKVEYEDSQVTLDICLNKDENINDLHN
jgi:hypothetical protein